MLRWVQGFHSCGLTFLREKVPRNWHVYCDQVTDNFRVCSATIRMEARVNQDEDCNHAW